MKLKAGILGLALICLGVNVYAYTSTYSAISVPGSSFLTWWSVTHNVLTNTADNVWSGHVTFPSNSGAFKFAANLAWTIDWGGNFTVKHPPARSVPLTLKGADLSYDNIPTGQYAVTFYEQTTTFDLVPVTPAPNPLAVQLIGSFNGDGATSVGTMTNTSGYVWETTVELDAGADFLFKVTAAAGSANRGALVATDILAVPFSDGNPCGDSRYAMSGVLGGTFVFTFNLQSNAFSIAQIQTNSFALSTVTAVGNFVAGSLPDINMEKISRSVWSSDFTVTNAASFTLSFIGRDAGGGIGRYWGATNASALPLPATGFMLASPSSNSIIPATLTAVPGSYRITFDSNSGEFIVQQRYAASSGINYLQNPSFESLSFGVPANWDVYHATSGEQADFGAHSGARCGVLKAKTIDADPDLGNFDQTTGILSGLSGQTFRVSAAFRTRGVWTAETVRIIVEWKNGDAVISENSTEVTGLNEQWQAHVLEAIVPSDSITAHVLFKYDGVPGTGYLLVDDAEARIAASRFQDFNGWGDIPQFTNVSPDWAVTSGRTIQNATDNAPTGGVVISKYIEGSDNNKAIEIFNGAATSNNLLTGQYFLQQYNHGSSTASVSIALSGIIPPGKCLVVSRLGTPTNAYPPDEEILSAGNNRFQTNVLTFNGDDVVVLRKGGITGAIVDRVGQVGPNFAGSIWSRNATDHSLHRKSSVLWGVTNSPTNSFSLSEWDILPQDSFGELGNHFFSLDDPNAPYNPTGYSLLLNTNASLLSPVLEGGIGDISFYARVQGALAGSPVQFAIESSTSQTSTNWTLAETRSLPLTTTNFTLISSYAAQSSHSVLRIRHIGDGTTNRLRIDDVLVGEAYKIKRTENFAAWTNFLDSPIGTYSLAEWTIQNAQIGTNAPFGNVCADIYPSAGAVTSPTFEGGIGTVNFWLSQHPQDRGEVRATILTSTNNGASWTAHATNALPAPSGTNVLKTNFTVAIYLPIPSSVRISANGSPNPFVVDNIEVAIPSISRILNFDDFALTGQNYFSYEKNGWNITDVCITTNLVYSGNSARMRASTIISPFIDSIGTISFNYMMAEFSGDNTARLTVEISANASSWTVLSSGIAPSAAPQLYSYFNTNTNYHYVRIRQTTSSKRIFIDQIEIGEPSPIPTCTITAALSPLAPAPNEGFYLTADVIPKNGADILSVTGAYQIDSAPWVSNALAAVAYGSYRSELLPPRAAGTKITYKASVRYAGTGAAPGSTSYTSNTAFSATNSLFVSSVKRGTVWINELFYAPYEGEEGGGFWGPPYDHEYIELCGVAGTSITNWKIRLLFCSAADVQKNNGQSVYATYTIPAGTVLSNTANGFGFYVIGDQELTTNHPINQVLTTLIPTNVMPDNPGARDHIHDRSGIVQLLDNYNNVVYSLSYGAIDSTSERILATQSLTSNTNSLSLSGTGSTYEDFSWNDDGALTIGEENTGQTLVPDTGLPPMGAWHTPAAVAQTALQGTFTQFHPIDAAQSDTLYIHYAYTNADFTYATIDGYVHHHKQGGLGAWNTASKQVDFTGNYDTNGFAYLRTSIPTYAYDRLDILEYVIEAIPNNPSLSTAYLGSDGSGSSTAYDSLEQAKLYPFRYTFPIADPIQITKMTIISNTVLRLETDGNDTLDPIVNFRVRYTTNLVLPPMSWNTLIPQSITRTNEQNYFTLTNPAGIKNFFAVQPLWP